MDASEVNYVAKRLYEHCMGELQMELPLLAALGGDGGGGPTWEDYLPQAQVALEAAAAWRSKNGISR